MTDSNVYSMVGVESEEHDEPGWSGRARTQGPKLGRHTCVEDDRSKVTDSEKNSRLKWVSGEAHESGWPSKKI